MPLLDPNTTPSPNPPRFLRHIDAIVVRNIISDSSIYFTLHKSENESPFYTSQLSAMISNVTWHIRLAQISTALHSLTNCYISIWKSGNSPNLSDNNNPDISHIISSLAPPSPTLSTTSCSASSTSSSLHVLPYIFPPPPSPSNSNSSFLITTLQLNIASLVPLCRFSSNLPPLPTNTFLFFSREFIYIPLQSILTHQLRPYVEEVSINPPLPHAINLHDFIILLTRVLNTQTKLAAIAKENDAYEHDLRVELERLDKLAVMKARNKERQRRLESLRERLAMEEEEVESLRIKVDQKREHLLKHASTLTERTMGLFEDANESVGLHQNIFKDMMNLYRYNHFALEARRKRMLGDLIRFFPIVQRQEPAARQTVREKEEKLLIEWMAKREVCDFYGRIPPDPPEVTSPPKYYSIRGLHLPPISSPFVSDDEDEVISSAFGYVAHLLTMFSKLLNVPLRYRIGYQGSRSTIQDETTSTPPLPLYVKGATVDRSEFAGVLLCRNIESFTRLYRSRRQREELFLRIESKYPIVGVPLDRNVLDFIRCLIETVQQPL